MLEKVQLTIQAGMKVQEVTDLEVFMVLGKLGLSQADIVVMVVTSGIMLFLICIFLSSEWRCSARERRLMRRQS